VNTYDNKIAMLISLALSSSFEDEARTSALLALRLAAKHGATIRVSAKSADVASDVSEKTASAPPPPAPPPPPGAPAPAPSRPYYRRAKAPKGPTWSRPFPARRADTCCSCNGPIHVGMFIEWSAGVGARCPACDPNLKADAAE
jgi:hypothetical protein